MPIYRAANLTNADRIALLHADSWKRTYRGILSDQFLDRDVVDNRREVWHARLGAASKNQFVIVAEDVARIVGFICMYGARALLARPFLIQDDLDRLQQNFQI